MMRTRALRAVRIALFVTGAGAATPASGFGQDLGCDRGDLEVRALEFRGNQAVSDAQLALRVATTASARARRWFRVFGERRCLNRDELPRDVIRLRVFYNESGFHAAQVDTIVSPVGSNGVRVVFTISEGQPTVLRRYDVVGLAGVQDSAAIANSHRLRVGNPFDINLLRADMDTIVQRLRNAGYYRAAVFHEYGWNRDSLFATARLLVNPGKRARFGVPDIRAIPVSGRPQQIANPVVARVMGIVPGSQYSDRAIVEAQRSLFSLGTYRHIEVSPLADSLQPAGDTIVVLRVQLTEDYMRQLDSEFGWATLDCGRMRLLYTDRNWAGTARRLEMTGHMSKIGYGAPLANRTSRDLCDFGGRLLSRDSAFSSVLHYYTGISVRQPRLLGFRWTPTVSLYSERRGEYTAYLRSTYVGADLSAIRDLAYRTPLRLGYTMEYGKTDAPDAALCALFSRCDPSSRAQLKSLATLGVASANLSRIRTDNPVTPSRGYAARAEFRSSASSLLGTSPNLFFNKASGDVAMYRPVGSGNVLAMRLRAGAVLGRRTASDAVGFVPPQERLYAGGATSVRGFQQNELGSLVYIGAGTAIDTIAITDSTFRIEARVAADSSLRIDRTVPLGGNSLAVVNLDYRIRDPFFFPDLLQYTIFVDGGDIGVRTAEERGFGIKRLKWTPGLGVRALTPVGPVQVNVGWNGYPRVKGPLYYNPNVSTLVCLTPNNPIVYKADGTGALAPVGDATCPADFQPPPRTRFLQQLTFTFSIGSDY